MTGAALIGGVLLAAAVAALLWSEWISSRLGIWITKPAASTIFVVVALSVGALDSSFGRLMLLGLVLSWFGDVLLIPDGRRFFIAGLASFLLGHLAFGAAFLLYPQDLAGVGIGAIGMAAFSAVVVRWLWPHVPGGMRIPVAAYVGVISVMVVLAAGTLAAAGPMLLTGAELFAVSDVFVARERFVASSVVNRLCGLPLYYSAQLIFALNVIGLR